MKKIIHEGKDGYFFTKEEAEVLRDNLGMISPKLVREKKVKSVSGHAGFMLFSKLFDELGPSRRGR